MVFQKILLEKVYFEKESAYDKNMKNSPGGKELNFADQIVCLFDLILYIPTTIFQLYRDGSSRVESVLS